MATGMRLWTLEMHSASLQILFTLFKQQLMCTYIVHRTRGACVCSVRACANARAVYFFLLTVYWPVHSIVCTYFSSRYKSDNFHKHAAAATGFLFVSKFHSNNNCSTNSLPNCQQSVFINNERIERQRRMNEEKAEREWVCERVREEDREKLLFASFVRVIIFLYVCWMFY